MPPLTGIRILDLTTVVAGPTATMILADLGADVIKVERIDGGDDSRGMGPLSHGWGCFFVSLNRGKRSIALDITKPEGREVVLRLVAKSDVVIENLRGGKFDALGFDDAALQTANPSVIHASLSGYGNRGPDAKKPAYDALIQGRTGIVSVTGTPGNTTRTGVSVIDTSAGMWAAMGILAALYERQSTGRGQRVDTSLFQSGVMSMAYHLAYEQFTGRSPEPTGTSHNAFGPYGAFQARDGRVMIGISNDRQFRRLADALGRPEWPTDPRFSTNVARVENRPALESLIEAILLEKPRAHWIALLESNEIPVSPIQTTAELMNDVQLAALGQLAPIALPGSNGELVAVPALPFELSETPAVVGSSLPSLGEHTREILEQAGYTQDEIEKLRAAGICM